MHRFMFLFIGVLVAASANAGDPSVKKTIDYVQKLQAANGAFRPFEAKSDEPTPGPTLRSTSAAIRALKYLGGELPNKEGCVKFVESCWDRDAGAFCDEPKGKPDVFTTAVGIMAVVNLQLSTQAYSDASIKYFRDNARTFEEVRLAAAGMENLKATTPKVELWHKPIAALRNDDGTFGKGPGLARDSASAAVTLMRLEPSADLPKERILKVIRAGQRQNGGWGKGDNEIASDLETTYRVMRCFMMLKAQPDNVEGVRSFVAKCRNADGGYGIAPGKTSTVGATYFAVITMHWLKTP
ncbi:MAG: hypothetical protein FJ303_01995 [Planctomycetes bacterium]|nr:hypothetical protein [Planctomycetota bacterium]